MTVASQIQVLCCDYVRVLLDTRVNADVVFILINAFQQYKMPWENQTIVNESKIQTVPRLFQARSPRKPGVNFRKTRSIVECPSHFISLGRLIDNQYFSYVIQFQQNMDANGKGRTASLEE